ncbi:MAG: hypothetical protein WC314_11200 [Vulcanimicrobiota bacterium]
MSDQKKSEFEEQFQRAISAGLKKVTVSDEFKQRLVEKLEFEEAMRAEVGRSYQKIKAPEEVRNRVLQALQEEAPPSPKVIPLPTRAQWNRGVKTLASLAAAFALVFLAIFSSADAVLASSVRADHKHCCDRAMQVSPNRQTRGLAAIQSRYDSLPATPVDESWELRVSGVCYTEDGQPMVHLLYTRDGGQGNLQSISFHFLPDQGGQRPNKYSLEQQELHLIAEGDFPVVGWMEGNWVCTACSPELDAETLKKAFSAGA